MRIWGRLPVTVGGDAETLEAANGTGIAAYKWVAVTEDARGYADYCWLTALVQCLKLNLGESPFWGNYGLPAKTSVLQQVPPDYNVALTQTFFAPHFASLIISKRPETVPPLPTYDVSIVRKAGSTFQTSVAL